MLKRQIPLFLLSIVILCISGCTTMDPQRTMAQKIADALPRVVGPASSYRVVVHANTFAMVRGHVDGVEIFGRDVQVAPNTVVDSLYLNTEDVVFDPHAQKLKTIRFTAFQAIMGQRYLNQYLQTRKMLPGLVISLRNQDVRVAVPVWVGPINSSVALNGMPAATVPASSSIDFTVDAASVGRLQIPSPIVNLVLREVNPIVDLSQMRMVPTIKQAIIAQGNLYITGNIVVDPSLLN